MTNQPPSLESLARRLARERARRLEAEAIAERVTSELYETVQELGRVNAEMGEMNRSLREFVAVAAHDLRSPLTLILGFAESMTTDWDAMAEDQKHEFVAIIGRSGRQLTRLLDDLLAVSRIEARVLDTRSEVISVRETFDEAMATFAEHASDIEILCPDEVSVVVDPDHLRRIVVNYVTNAFKYGKPPVGVEVIPREEFVEIRVRDRGDGVPEEFVANLFGKFTRADTDATRREQGTGLGLSIVKGLAEANGGEAWYEPNRPVGSCFAVRLPKATAA